MATDGGERKKVKFGNPNLITRAAAAAARLANLARGGDRKAIKPEASGLITIAEAAEALGGDVATKADIKLLDGKITLLLWAVGINVAATITMLVKH